MNKLKYYKAISAKDGKRFERLIVSHPVSRRLISAKDKDPKNGKPAIDKTNPAIPTGSDFRFA